MIVLLILLFIDIFFIFESIKVINFSNRKLSEKLRKRYASFNGYWKNWGGEKNSFSWIKDGMRNGRKYSKNQDNDIFFASKIFYFTKRPCWIILIVCLQTITTDVVVLARCPEEIPASSTNEIRKLPTTHLATSSTRKLRPSVRREGITRRENDANECGRKYY